MICGVLLKFAVYKYFLGHLMPLVHGQGEKIARSELTTNQLTF